MPNDLPDGFLVLGLQPLLGTPPSWKTLRIISHLHRDVMVPKAVKSIRSQADIAWVQLKREWRTMCIHVHHICFPAWSFVACWHLIGALLLFPGYVSEPYSRICSNYWNYMEQAVAICDFVTGDGLTWLWQRRCRCQCHFTCTREASICGGGEAHGNWEEKCSLFLGGGGIGEVPFDSHD